MKLQILKEYFLHLFLGQGIDPAITINFTFLIKQQMIRYLAIPDFFITCLKVIGDMDDLLRKRDVMRK